MKKLICSILSLSLTLSPISALTQSLQLEPLPDGNASGISVTPTQEIELGKQVQQSIFRHMPLIHDPISNHYLEQLGARLEQHIQGEHVPLRFYLIKANPINAFALPGGHIVIHSGLLTAADKEAELAGVLAHEITHVTQRHIAQMLEKMQQMTIPTIAAMVAAIAVATQNPSIGSSAIAATMAGTQQYAINFTRENEEEADRIGIMLLARSGFSPQGMPDFFKKLEKNSRYYQSSGFDFLRTHPINNARIADTSARARDLNPKLDHSSNLDFQIVQERLNVMLAQNTRQTLYRYQEQVKQQPNLLNQYGYTLSLLENGKQQQATTLAQKLLQQQPENWYLKLLLAEVYLNDEHPKKALDLLADKELPHNYAVQLYSVRALLNNKSYRQAKSKLDMMVTQYEQRPELYDMLYEASVKLNKNADAHIARATYFKLLGLEKDAIMQLQIALKQKNQSEYDIARLQAKLHQLQKVQKKKS